jgi:hypothetical protein
MPETLVTRIIGTSAGELNVADMVTSAANTARCAAWVIATIPLVLSLIYFGGVALGAPAESDVVPEGHTPITWEVAEPSGRLTYGPLVPTTSLANVRCQSWIQDHAGTCPDEQTLAGMYWTKLQQAPQTLYVGAFLCDTTRRHFNVEYFESRLTLHCHSTARLINPWQGPHSDAGPGAAFIELLIVPTVSMIQGQVSIFLEDRIERRFSDIVSTKLIGVATIAAGEGILQTVSASESASTPGCVRK